ncbi:Zinc finger, BED-type [Trema orientale]|uniref:Zinc finger, BED-type n=1 Tax=Trema orientale TaxID=63057 RepID=A0A2P5E7A1_TREOI|nr:Zinc finger, BED-type [Trema orientale]
MVRSLKKSCIGTSPSGTSSVGGGNRKDPAWRHGVEIENPGGKKYYVYLECKYCKKAIKGGVKRMKDHLAHTRKNVAPCKEVPEDVKNEFVEYLSKGTKNKHLAQAQFDERVDSDAYFGSVMDGGAKSCNPISSIRGVRGPMNRFITNLDDDDEDVRNKAARENDEEDSPKTDDEELDVDVFGEEDPPSGVSGIQSRSTKSHNKNTLETSKAAGKRKKHVTDVDENEEEWNDLDSDDGKDDRAIRYDDTSEDPSSHDDLDDY